MPPYNNLNGNHVKTESENREEAGLKPEQIAALRDISTIRDKKQDHEQNRLADFNKQQSADHESPAEQPFIKEDQLVVINGQRIHNAEEMVVALLGAYGPQPELYGFETYENTDAREGHEQEGLER